MTRTTRVFLFILIIKKQKISVAAKPFDTHKKKIFGKYLKTMVWLLKETFFPLLFHFHYWNNCRLVVQNSIKNHKKKKNWLSPKKDTTKIGWGLCYQYLRWLYSPPKPYWTELDGSIQRSKRRPDTEIVTRFCNISNVLCTRRGVPIIRLPSVWTQVPHYSWLEPSDTSWVKMCFPETNMDYSNLPLFLSPFPLRYATRVRIK